MPKIDLSTVQTIVGSRYPKPFDEPVLKRSRQPLGDAAGLTQFGINLVRLPPGCWSSQRHWHAREDEFLWVLEGELVLIEDGGETVLRAGDCAGWKAGVRDGHHLQNRSDRDARVLVVGTRDREDSGEYSDIDMKFVPAGFQHKDGTPY